LTIRIHLRGADEVESVLRIGAIVDRDDDLVLGLQFSVEVDGELIVGGPELERTRLRGRSNFADCDLLDLHFRRVELERFGCIEGAQSDLCLSNEFPLVPVEL